MGYLPGGLVIFGLSHINSAPEGLTMTLTFGGALSTYAR